MQVKVYNNRMTLIDTLYGTFSDGNFVYKKNQTKILKWKVGGQEAKIQVDFEKTTQEGDQKVASVIFDGKDYKQISFTQLGTPDETKSFNNFERDFKIGQLTKRTMLTQPTNNFKTLMEIIFFITVIFSLFGIYFQVHSVGNTVKPIILAINKTLAQNQVTIQLINNQTVSMVKFIHSLATTTASTSSTVP